MAKKSYINHVCVRIPPRTLWWVQAPSPPHTCRRAGCYTGFWIDNSYSYMKHQNLFDLCLSRLPGFKNNACDSQNCRVRQSIMQWGLQNWMWQSHTNSDESHYFIMTCLQTSICRGLECSNPAWAIYTGFAASIDKLQKGCKMFNQVFIECVKL